MRQARPRGPGAGRLLSEAKARRGVGERMELLSRLLLGRPYVAHGLVGSAEVPEKLVASLEAFDCVTYMEAVLALALANSARAFPEQLRRIRYEGGVMAWVKRNHYMTGWIDANTRAGFVRPLVFPGAVARRRVLDAVPGLPARRVRFVALPKRALPRLGPRLATGDLLFFASTRPRLDVFHCGILVKEGDHLLMRHAARSRGGVVEQPLAEFLAANRMAGVLAARPLEREKR